MGDLRDLIPDQQRRKTSVTGFWRGIFVEAPTIESDLLKVILPDIDPELFFGPCKWSPRHTRVQFNLAEGLEAPRNFFLAVPLWPSVGDLCLVTKSNQGYYWVVEWWPYGGDQESVIG